jgi:hypothetical protein
MAFDRDKKYYVQQEWKGFFPGMELDIAGYSDHKLEKFLDEGIIGTSVPTEPEADNVTEVPAVSEADAKQPVGRRSAELTGQPNPDKSGTNEPEGKDNPTEKKSSK